MTFPFKPGAIIALVLLYAAPALPRPLQTITDRGTLTPFVLEGELMAALDGGEIDAAAITPTAIGWYNKVHQQAHIRALPVFADNPDLNWNLAVGMIGPDDRLRERIDAALGDMLADG